MPGTSAYRVIVGTTSRPFASRPITAGGPPPEANTRSKPLSSSRAARRKSATTLTMPRRMTTSRISSATQASIWSSDWSARRARYSFGFAESAVAVTLPPVSSGRVHGLGVWQSGRLRGRPGVLSRPFRPVVEALGHPPTDATRDRDVRGVGDEDPEGCREQCCRFGNRLARGPTGDRDRLPHPDADASAEAQPARAVDRDRNQRDAGPQREVSRSLADRKQLGLADVDP